MKKLLIGALVGGIIIFVWQTLSFTMLNLHSKAFQYTPKQQEVLDYLSTQFSDDGQYLIPNLPPTASSDDHKTFMQSAQGKPWAMISYHKIRDVNMVMNMIRGLLVDIVAVGLLCWILLKMNQPALKTIMISSLFTGLIGFLYSPYTAHIWYEHFDIMAHFMDAIIAWGVCGLWLGWWLTRDKKKFGVNKQAI